LKAVDDVFGEAGNADPTMNCVAHLQQHIPFGFFGQQIQIQAAHGEYDQQVGWALVLDCLERGLAELGQLGLKHRGRCDHVPVQKHKQQEKTAGRRQ